MQAHTDCQFHSAHFLDGDYPGFLSGIVALRLSVIPFSNCICNISFNPIYLHDYIPEIILLPQIRYQNFQYPSRFQPMPVQSYNGLTWDIPGIENKESCSFVASLLVEWTSYSCHWVACSSSIILVDWSMHWVNESSLDNKGN